MTKKFKRFLSTFLCIAMVMCNLLPSLASVNVEESESKNVDELKEELRKDKVSEILEHNESSFEYAENQGASKEDTTNDDNDIVEEECSDIEEEPEYDVEEVEEIEENLELSNESFDEPEEEFEEIIEDKIEEELKPEHEEEAQIEAENDGAEVEEIEENLELSNENLDEPEEEFEEKIEDIEEEKSEITKEIKTEAKEEISETDEESEKNINEVFKNEETADNVKEIAEELVDESVVGDSDQVGENVNQEEKNINQVAENTDLSDDDFATSTPSEIEEENLIENIKATENESDEEISTPSNIEVDELELALVDFEMNNDFATPSIVSSELIGNVQTFGDASTNTLCFTSNTDGSTVGYTLNSLSARDIKKSTDGSSWSSWDGTSTTLNISEKLYVKGSNPSGLSQGVASWLGFSISGDISISGSVMGLLDDGACTTTTIPNENCFVKLFYNCSGLTSISNDLLPATTLSDYCYEYMFWYCSGLTSLPSGLLPAYETKKSCYYRMFDNCTNLTTVAADLLPATTLSESCYSYMFNCCSNLTNAPDLPAEELKYMCYEHMFASCTKLEKTPKLNATQLANQCYGCMFYLCTSLTIVPELPATTLGYYCYKGMFYGCTNLILNIASTSGREKQWKIPASVSAEGWNGDMFDGCTNVDLDGSGGKTCALNTTYYTVPDELPMIITTSPETNYRTGDTFDPTGLVVTLSDDSSTVVNYSDDAANFSFEPNITTTLSSTDTEVKITYQATDTYAATLNINVYDPTSISGVTWTGGSQPTIKMGTTFDPTNMKAKFSYPAGLSETEYAYTGHESDFTISTPITTTPILSNTNTAPLEFTCKGLTYNNPSGLTLTMPTSGTLTDSPTKTSYFEGEAFDFSGMSVTLNFSDSTTTGPFSYDGYPTYFSTTQTPALGDTSIEVKFCNTTISVPITVSAKSLTGISVNTPPTTTEYFEDDTFDPTGLVIEKSFDYGSPDTLTYSDSSGITYSPTTLSSGTTYVTITYNTKTTTQAVTLHTASSLQIVASPSKTTYYAGDTFDPSGLILKVIDSGFSKNYTYTSGLGMTFNPSGALSTSTTAVTVTFKGNNVSIPITVSAKPTPTPTPRSGGGSSSGGSSGGSSGPIASIKTDNQIQQNQNDLVVANNPVAPENVTQISRNTSTEHVINANTTNVNWVTDNVTGKWKLNIGGSSSGSNDENGGAEATYGFYNIAKDVSEIDMQTGLDVIKTTMATYYFDQNSLMHIGWLTTADLKTYYFEVAKTPDEGRMINGWKDIDSKWYYFNSNGELLRNITTPDGYSVDVNGVWVK